MRRNIGVRHHFIVSAFALMLSACVAVPMGLQYFPGGTRIDRLGISFVLPTDAAPADKAWTTLIDSTYQAVYGTQGRPNETVLVAVSTQNVPEFSNPEAFLDFVKEKRAEEPDTGTFEVIRNEERLYAERSEVCVKHESASKDFSAKRGGDYSVIEYHGMNCIHPKDSSVVIFVELSRKAPAGLTFPQFRTAGEQFLQSVEFSAYR